MCLYGYQQIYKQNLLQRAPLKVVDHAKCALRNTRFGLKYNEASKCNFVLHATDSIIHGQRKQQEAKRIPWGSHALSAACW